MDPFSETVRAERVKAAVTALRGAGTTLRGAGRSLRTQP
jgi:hypothetical protein